MPACRRGDAWTNVVAHPLKTHRRWSAGERVETDLQPVGEAVGDLERLVHRVLRRQQSVLAKGRAGYRVVAVQLDHGTAARYELGAVHLDFVVVLPVCRARRREQEESDRTGREPAEYPCTREHVEFVVLVRPGCGCREMLHVNAASARPVGLNATA